MEETNEQFKFKELYYQFPRFIQVDFARYQRDNFIAISESPFGNRQTFTIARAYKLSNLNEEEIINLFSKIYIKLGRAQMIIDLKDEYNELTLKAIKCIIKNIITIPYVSTNNSHMNLHIIQLDTDKLN